jgi:nucleoside-triphosphatase
MKLIISGRSGSGKSTLINDIIKKLNTPVYGFITKKYDVQSGTCPVYIHALTKPLSFSEANRIGSCRDQKPEKRPFIFDSYGVYTLKDIPEGALVIMDELGVMEEEAKRFKKRVFEVMNGKYNVIAAVRDKHTLFLDEIRAVKNAEIVNISENNRTAAAKRAYAIINKAYK